ncbi:carbohydrate ABC transporter permease [Halegenticoccus tardaugens]|uniref:carbohydrate ABC transporter permease n=1 Tax=Halegenticoccus tardaugens TaxID=2071624 RepID=UPI00100B53D1|nr:sugar ABC transporter permease [Halegenticoccus tardaugens]
MSVNTGFLPEPISNAFAAVTGSFERLQNTPVTWIAPAAFFLLIFRLYPLFEAVRMSFTNMSLTQTGYEYIGLQSYLNTLSSPAFWTMGRVTVLFVSASVILQLVCGFILALAIDYGVKEKLRGSVTTRVAVLSAWVIPGIVIGILWKIMLIETNYGVVNYLLVQLGFDVVSFLSDPQMALLSTIIANTWRGTAFSMIMLYAGLQQVPTHLYDAAKVDGAKAFQRFRYVTLPHIKPVVFINLVLITIYTLNTFDLIMSLTGGGPGQATEVLALFMYFEGFNRFNLGDAAAVAVLMLLVNIVMTAIYMHFFIDEEAM